MSARELYEVFSGYSRPHLRDAYPDACSAGDGVSEKIDEELRRKSLGDLSDADLLDYYYLAVYHVGTSEDFKFYLPRILELMTTVRRRPPATAFREHSGGHVGSSRLRLVA